MLHVALVEPEIPPNTGNIARLCAATRTPLHIVGVTGFRMDDRTLKRSGLDYWDEVDLYRHVDLDALFASLPESRFVFMTTKSDVPYTSWTFRAGDCLVFGPETRGLPLEILELCAIENRLRVPMLPDNRSLNLSNAVAVVAFEAWRQLGYSGGA